MVWTRAALPAGDAVLVRLLLEGIIVLEGLGEDGTVHLGTGQDGVRLAGQLLLEPAPRAVSSSSTVMRMELASSST